MKKQMYYKGWFTENCLAAETEKALCSWYDVGTGSRNYKTLWIPKSICKFEPANKNGNVTIYVPAWFFTKNRYEYKRCKDIAWTDFVEM